MPTTAPKPPLDPEAPARPSGLLPPWVSALMRTVPPEAWTAALETAPVPGAIEFPVGAAGQLPSGLSAFVRHIMELAGEFGESGGGASMRQLNRPLTSLPRFAREEAGSIGESQPFRTRLSPRLQERLAPTQGAEAETEATALLRLLLNPAFYNKYYRGPFPK